MLIMIMIILILLFIYYYYYNYSNSENFNSKNDKIKVYNYYTTWCGWSQKFLPEWNKFKDLVSKSDSIEAIEIICDDMKNNDKCLTVPGFPSVIIEKNGKDITYESDRSAQKILDFINNL